MNPLIFIMGVSGSGKSTIGSRLSMRTGIPFFDGDDFHSSTNREKMHAGHPLDDEDRKDWLDAINKLAVKQVHSNGVIIACSALKEKYRQQLVQKIDATVHWVCLTGNYELVWQRIQNRKDHFMPASLLQSQFEILEIPAGAITPDITKSPDEIVDLLMAQTGLAGKLV
jgi:carbohydrate kinase (thermoresistant glucokinase family)